MIARSSDSSQTRDYFYYETKEEHRVPDTLTKIVTGDVDFVQVPDRGKDVYWQHWYGVDFGRFAGVNPVQIERFLRPFAGSITNEGIDEGESRFTYALKPGTDSAYSYNSIMNSITPLYYTATKSPNESIYFKNASFPKPLESNGIQFVFNPREVFITARRFGNISFAEADKKEKEEAQIYNSTIAGQYDQYINTIQDYIDRQFSSAVNDIKSEYATSSFFGTPKNKGVIQISTYDTGIFELEIVEANKIKVHPIKDMVFGALKLKLSKAGITKRTFREDFYRKLKEWNQDKYEQKIVFTEETGKPNKLRIANFNHGNWISQWSQASAIQRGSSKGEYQNLVTLGDVKRKKN